MSKTLTIAKTHSPTRERRLKMGREARTRLSRKLLGCVHSRNRNFDPIDLLMHCEDGRVPSILPVKYGRMAASAFAFFRGSVGIMAADLAQEPHTGLTVQLCGDAHLQNLGSFAGPDGRLVFDINDFDESIPGPWEWDVKRMAASIVLAGNESNHGRATCSKAVEAFSDSYCKLIEEMAEEPVLSAARYQIRRLKKTAVVSSALVQAERATPCDLLAKYTVKTQGGKKIFKKTPNALWRVTGEERASVLESLDMYRAGLAPERIHWFQLFEPQDVAFKVVGTGSVGLRDYVILMFGNGQNDPLFLQVKQEVESAYAPYLTGKFVHQGQRVAEGQRRIQPLSDLLLGWTRIGGQDYVVRQMNDHKGSINLNELRDDGLTDLARIAGELLARGHARSGDALQLKGYIGSYEKVSTGIVDFALEYAAQAQADFEQFQKAIRDGRIKALTDEKKPNRKPSTKHAHPKPSSAKASA